MSTNYTAGRLAYEADCLAIPTYHDGAPRKSWDQLDETARWSWEREAGSPRFCALALAQADWGMYWLRAAVLHPEQAGACHHNSRMNALHIMALEAAQ